MPSLPTSEWTSALDRMTVALNRMLIDLDRSQKEWSPRLEIQETPVHADRLLKSVDDKLTQWDERLTVADEMARAVENQIEDREAAFGQWQNVFIRWKELIERLEDRSNFSPG